MVEVSRNDVEKVLKKVNSSSNYENYEIIALSDKPIGFLADHSILRVKFKPQLDFKDFFLKAVPKNVEKRLEYIDETGFFVKEIEVYQNIIPRLSPFSSLSWAPELYLAKDGHFLIMEILQDYKIKSNQSLVFDFDHLKVSAISLACMHASSVIFEEKSGKKLKEHFQKMLDENAYVRTIGHVRQKGLENGIRVLTKMIDLIPRYKDSSEINFIREKFPETLRKIYDFTNPFEKYRSVFSHGDLWVNNCMFKYEDNKPISCKFVDFQLARYSAPAFDLTQLIYINSTTKTRVTHLDDILNTYCDMFESELKKHNVDPSTLPRTEILASFKDFHLAGLIEAVLFGHLTLLPPTSSTNILSSSEEYDKFINQSRIQTCLKAFKEEDYYRDRLTELLTEIIEYFILIDR